MYEGFALAGGFVFVRNHILFLFFCHDVTQFLGGDFFHGDGVFLVVAYLFERPKDNDEQASGDAGEVAKERSESHISREVFPKEGKPYPWGDDAGEDIDAI